ncbi:MAG: hypothetical protein A2Y78_08810 [Acidobacteria bacterium RBG_13_68_16]|nr:MAG: hypothetical protein A2Y78_08810 [Acidobacteria bacterium RBG_13_68_16]
MLQAEPSALPAGTEAALAMRRQNLLALIGAALVLTMGFETVQLPLTIQAQTIPLTGVLAVFVLPFVALLSGVRRFTPVFTIVTAFCVFAAVHSVVALGIDTLFSGSNPVRTTAWLRQLAALAVGFAVFFVLRTTLVAFTERRIAMLAVWAACPGVLLALLNVLWGLGVWPDAGKIVWTLRLLTVPRGLVVPPYFSQADRAAGFCSEPSHFAFFLAVITLPPTLALLSTAGRIAWFARAALAVEAVAFVWAFSVTGWLVVGGMLLVLALNRSTRRVALATLGAAAVLIVALVLAFPDNYLLFQARGLWSGLVKGEPGGFLPSATVIVFGTLGPFARAFSSLNLLGYGLGGTTTHLAAMIPAVGQRDIIAASWAGMPTLTTSAGRVFAETGLVGFAMFVGIWVVAFRALRQLRRAPAGDGTAAAMLNATSLALVGLAVGHTVKFGSFALPYLWFWLAYVDSRSLRNGRQAHQD